MFGLMMYFPKVTIFEGKWEELREEKRCKDPLVTITCTKPYLILSSKLNFFPYFKENEKSSMLKIHLHKIFCYTSDHLDYPWIVIRYHGSSHCHRVSSPLWQPRCPSTCGKETSPNTKLWPCYGQHIPRLTCKWWRWFCWIKTAFCKLVYFQEHWYQKNQFWNKEPNYLEVRVFFGKSVFLI